MKKKNKTKQPSGNFTSVSIYIHSIYSKLFLDISELVLYSKCAYYRMSIHRRSWGKGLGASLLCVHRQHDSTIAAAPAHSSSLRPGWSSLQVTQPLCWINGKVNNLCQLPETGLGCGKLFVQATEELPVTCSYCSPDLEMNQKIKKSMLEHFQWTYAVPKEEKSIIREKNTYVLYSMYFINVSTSQARKKSPIPFFSQLYSYRKCSFWF